MDTPEPLQSGSAFSSAMGEIKKAGFTGSNVFLAGHSLGGVMSQKYDTNEIMGHILEGSVLLRGTRKVQANGLTKFNVNKPVLTLCGELDGLMRVSRCAESYYHQVENIDPSQKGMFPIIALKGVSHWSFSSGNLPSNVLNNDFLPEIEADLAYQQMSLAYVGFIGKVANIPKASSAVPTLVYDFKPLVESMKLENSYYLRDPCYS